ncbi:Uncharacterised protein [Moraxella ovis]|uniref:Uncharacterized protein n=1 Tax=Moraxella ovis TaxID=29433 RepID=A0A378PIW6_9GAMM|nr:Uncharacterised protein [Moraxella ovis]STY86336.1 Uncharacterised protein [Moraxella ovis]STZ06384.1 Uncharacterised protein [Moraxella ovis]
MFGILKINDGPIFITSNDDYSIVLLCNFMKIQNIYQNFSCVSYVKIHKNHQNIP